MLKSVKWGKYKLGSLFDIQNTLSFNTNKLVKGDEYDYITRTSLNQGVLRRTGYVNKENINPAGTWSLGLLQMDFFYRNRPWYAGQFVRKIVPKIAIPDNTILFFQTLLNKQKKVLLQVLVRYVDDKFRNTTVFLPQTEDKEIDYAFIGNFVRKLEESHLGELEEERLHKLEAYLFATGLNDFHLTDNDHEVLNRFKKMHWKEFCIGDLFERVKTVKLLYNAKALPKQPTGKNTLPCLTSSFMNQGLNYYAPREGSTILNNVISIPSNSDVYRAYYQPDDFTVLSDSYAIRWKDKSVSIQPKQYLYMVACINKVTNLPIYSYKNKLGGWNVVKNKYIVLPVNDDNQPDLVVMDQLITVMQKVAIADVVRLTAQRLDATRQIIESDELMGKDVIELNPSKNNDLEIEFEPLMAAEPFERYKWEGFDQSINDFFGGNQTILIGCYKGKKYQKWVHSHNMYNIRLGKTKGSMEVNRELFAKTSLLVLYEFGKPDKLSAYKITGHHEISKDELVELDYPNKKPRKSYMAFDIVPLERDLSFLVEHHLIERLIEIDSNNAKGTPIFIEP